MKRIIKCGTAFLLALVLCLCLLPTTAFAASKQVYIWNFPLSDDTLKSSGNWGHGVLNLRFGYRVGASSYTQFRCLDSWQGEVIKERIVGITTNPASFLPVMTISQSRSSSPLLFPIDSTRSII